MASNKLRIYLKAYDHSLLDESAKKIVEVAKKSGAEVVGPMPLPTKIKKYTVLRSVHVNKDSREQFEMRVHRRIDRKSTRLNSSHANISYAVFCLKKKK